MDTTSTQDIAIQVTRTVPDNNIGITELIKSNGTRPSKAEVYALAAELVDAGSEGEFNSFCYTVMCTLSFYEHYHDYGYRYYDYKYRYYCDYGYRYHRDCEDECSKDEKVIALLLLSAMYS